MVRRRYAGHVLVGKYSPAPCAPSIICRGWNSEVGPTYGTVWMHVLCRWMFSCIGILVPYSISKIYIAQIHSSQTHPGFNSACILMIPGDLYAMNHIVLYPILQFLYVKSVPHGYTYIYTYIVAWHSLIEWAVDRNCVSFFNPRKRIQKLIITMEARCFGTPALEILFSFM